MPPIAASRDAIYGFFAESPEAMFFIRQALMR